MNISVAGRVLSQREIRATAVKCRVLPLDSISYAGLDVALEDEAEKLYVSAAAFLLPHPSVANYLTVELARLKEMTQALADLFGLRLPVSCKKQAH